jgi:predicted porin
MKKSLIALAVLGSMVGAASAQSSVTLFGILDANLSYAKSGSQTLKSMGTDGFNSSRLGFRGTEDLGGGLKAGFWLESAVNPDNGTSNASRFWHRRSSVSLMGEFGEVRLGRYLTNNFTAFADFDAFGTNGKGDVNKLHSTLGSGALTSVRADNIVGYFLPAMGGLYGSVEVSAGEGTDGNKSTGVRLGYAAGPLNVTGAVATTKAPVSNYKRNTVAGSYDLGVVKLMGAFTQNKYRALKQTVTNIGATMPMGSGSLRASYTNIDQTGADANQFAVGYVHDLSKRTALYTTYSRISNDGASRLAVAGSPAVAAGKDSSGFEVGVRHSF